MKEQEIEKLISEAKKLRNNGNYPESLALLHQLNTEHSDNASYRYLLAATYYEFGGDDLAEPYVLEAMAIDPLMKENYELLGDIYQKQGKKKEAIEIYEKALTFDPMYMTVQESLIQLYINSGNFGRVLELCNSIMSYIPVDVSSAKARSLTSIYFGCVLYKGWALVYLGRYEEAIAEIKRRKVLNIQTNYPSYPNQYKDDDEVLFKLYYILNESVNLQQQEQVLKENYAYTDEKIQYLEEEAKKGILLARQRIYV